MKVRVSSNNEFYDSLVEFLTFELPTGKKVALFSQWGDDIYVDNVYYSFFMYYNGVVNDIEQYPMFNTNLDKLFELVEERQKFKLKDYQKKIVENFYNLRSKKCYFDLPTGAGKSMVFLILALLLIANGYRVVYSVNNRKILAQFYEQYAKKYSDLVKIWYKEEPTDWNLAIVAPPSLYKVVNGQKNIVLLIDEGHIGHKEYIAAVDSNIVVGVVVTTATPPDKNVKKIDGISSLRKLATFYYLTGFNNITPETTTEVAQLLVKKLYANVIVCNFYNNVIINAAKSKKFVEVKRKISNWVNSSDNTKYALGLFNSFFVPNTITQDVLSNVLKLVKKIDDKIIVFVKSLYKLFSIYSFLKDHGVKVAIAYGRSNNTVINTFLKSNEFQVLVTSPVSREGIDYKGIKHLVSVDNYVSVISFLQLVGRIMRTNDTNEANVYIFVPRPISIDASVLQYLPSEIIPAVNNMIYAQKKQIINNLKQIPQNYQLPIDVVIRDYSYDDPNVFYSETNTRKIDIKIEI